MGNKKTVKIFTMEQQFPCGPKSNCCGPLGQSEQEVRVLKNAVEKIGASVEIHDIQKIKNLQDNPQVFKLFRTFGPQAIPIITVDKDVACMGQSDVDEIVSAVKSKL